MKQYRPTYYKDFRCIASACKDNCCIGWEIDIDEPTATYYRGIGGDFGCRLKNNILCDENGSQFILKSDERCPFLNEQNLCDIYIHLGEAALCEICTQHPRYHEWFGDWKESGVGLCCEAAGRLIFSQDKTEFETVDLLEEAGDTIDEEAFSALFAARGSAIQLMQKRNIPLAQRLTLLVHYGEELQEALDWEDYSAIKEIAEEYENLDSVETIPPSMEGAGQFLEFLAHLEPIDPKWPSHLQKIAAVLPAVTSSFKDLRTHYRSYDKDMEQLAVYLLFRYFCKALFDGNIRSKTMLCAAACLLVTLLDGMVWLEEKHFDLEDRVLTAKAFSKEIEYCTENLDALCEGFWSGESLTQAQLLELISGIFL